MQRALEVGWVGGGGVGAGYALVFRSSQKQRGWRQQDSLCRNDIVTRACPSRLFARFAPAQLSFMKGLSEGRVIGGGHVPVLQSETAPSAAPARRAEEERERKRNHHKSTRWSVCFSVRPCISLSGSVAKSQREKILPLRPQLYFCACCRRNQKRRLALFLSAILHISATVVVQTQMVVVENRRRKGKRTTKKNKPTKPIAASGGATFEAENCARRKRSTYVA